MSSSASLSNGSSPAAALMATVLAAEVAGTEVTALLLGDTCDTGWGVLPLIGVLRSLDTQPRRVHSDIFPQVHSSERRGQFRNQ